MDKAINLHGEKYISARRASEITKYTSDYIGQLCRSKKIDAKLIGRSWYVSKKEILKYKNSQKSSDIDLRESPSVFTRDNKKTKKVISKVFKPSTFRESSVFKPKSEAIKINYIRDNEPLFPKVVKKFDYGGAKYIALKSLEESLIRPKKTSFIERFAFSSAVVSFILLFTFGFVFEKENISKLVPSNFGSHLKEEVSFLYGPYANEFQSNYLKFKKDIFSINQGGSQLASSLFSAQGWRSTSDWLKNIGYKIVEPWLQKNTPVLVNENNNSSQSSSTIGEGIARTVFVAGSSKEYVDLKIDELKKYFLALPFISASAPNVNRYYITNQNDRIVDLISRSSSNSTSGTVTSIATNNGLTGGTITTSGTIGLNVAGLSTNGLITWDGSNLVATGTPQLTVGNLLATSTTATSQIWGNVGISTSTPWAQFAINPIAGQASNQFVVGSSTATSFIINNAGNVGIGTTTPGTLLSLGNSGTDYVNISTTATSTFGSGINVLTGCFAVNGTCVGGSGGSGTVTSIATNNGLTGGTITTSGTIGLNVAGLSTNGLITWDGSNLVATGTPQLTVGNLLATSTTATSQIWGNLGISTSTPWAQFAINPMAGQASNQFVVGSSTATSFIINNAGNVGIGTTTPGTLLSLGNSGTDYVNISTTATSTFGSGINVKTGCFAVNGTCVGGGSSFTNTLASGGTATTTFYNGGVIFASSTGSGLLSQSAAAKNFFWDETDKRLGLGTSSPTSILSLQPTGSTNDLFRVSSSTGAALFTINKYGALVLNLASTSAVDIQNGSGGSVFTVDTTQSTGAGIDITAASGQTANLFNIYQSDGATNFFTVDQVGRVGVGTSTPYYSLTIASTTAPQLALSAGAGVAQWVFRNAGGNLYLATTTVAGTATTSVAALTINGTNGNVEIGSFATSDDNSRWVCIDAGGASFLQAGVNAASGDCDTSSQTVKHDIADITESGLDALAQMRPISFVYNGDETNTTMWGFIAEELDAISPTLAGHDAEGNPRSVQKNAVLAILSKALQEEDVKVNVLSSSTILMGTRLTNLEANTLIATSTLYVNTIESALGKNLTLNLDTEGRFIINHRASTTNSEEASSTPAIVFDSFGNAFFAGQIMADGFSTGNFSDFEDMTIGQLAAVGASLTDLNQTSSSTSLSLTSIMQSLNTLASSTASTTLKLAFDFEDLSGRLLKIETATSTNIDWLLSTSTEGLIIGTPITLSTGLQVDQIASISDYLNLISNTEFIGRPYFNSDTAGFAVMGEGSREVTVIFEKEYLGQPIVNATISFEAASSTATSSIPFGGDGIEEQIFSNDVRFLITNKSEKGFTILLNKPAPMDIPFSWTTLAVRSPNIFTSTSTVPVVESEVTIIPPASSSFETTSTDTSTTSTNTSTPPNPSSSDSSGPTSTTTPASTPEVIPAPDEIITPNEPAPEPVVEELVVEPQTEPIPSSISEL